VLAYIQMDIISFIKIKIKINKYFFKNSFLYCGMDGNHPTRDMAINEIDI